MINYAFEHLHHETRDIDAAVEFYKGLFSARTDPPFERGGATWVRVHIGDVRIMVTNRDSRPMELGRYQGYDHLGLTTDDFDAALAAVQERGIPIWTGPLTLENGQRIVFISGPDNIKIELIEKV